jgi:hypothetical protein
VPGIWRSNAGLSGWNWWTALEVAAQRRGGSVIVVVVVSAEAAWEWKTKLPSRIVKKAEILGLYT